MFIITRDVITKENVNIEVFLQTEVCGGLKL